MKASQQEDGNKCIIEKGHLSFQMTLNKSLNDSVFFLFIRNTQSTQQYALKLDNFDIGGDKKLVNVFRTGEDVYKQIVGDFDAIEIEESNEEIKLSLEVKFGKFRTQRVTLIVKNRTGTQELPQGWEDSKTQPANKKVLVDPTYTSKDYSDFKHFCMQVCDNLVNHQVSRQISGNKNLVKNILISISNALLRNYKKDIQPINKNQSMKDYHQFKPVSKLLIQQNQLLHNILKNAAEKAQTIQVPNLQLQINIQEPKQVIVVDQEGLQIPLKQYLPKDNPEEFYSKLDYFEKRSKQLKAIKEKCKSIENEELRKFTEFVHERNSRLRVAPPIRKEGTFGNTRKTEVFEF